MKPWCLFPRASVSGRVMDKAKQCHIIVELTFREENSFPNEKKNEQTKVCVFTDF